MNIFFEPVNVNEWNIFDNVSGIGHIETFIATKKMELGDIVLLHVGKQNKNYESGVYAIGLVVSKPYVYNKETDGHCYNRLSVDVKVLKIDYFKPIITYEQMLKYNKQFRSTHIIDERYYAELLLLI